MRAVLLLLGLAVASAARMSVTNSFLSDQMSGNLRAGVQSMFNRVSRHHSGDEGDETAYLAIRFIVPASESDGFEKRWEDLQRRCEKEEKVDHLSLKKTMLDNVVYWSYGEWDSMRDMHDHFESDHFKDFSDYVDEHDIMYEIKLMDNFSEEIEKRQRKKQGDVKLRFHKDNAHILTHYYVPPGEAEGFTDAWTKAAEDTIDEKGNYLYSLRKVRTDNTRFVSYGSWDRMSDWLDHYESKHLGKLHDYTADKEIIWWHEILEEAVEEKDMRA